MKLTKVHGPIGIHIMRSPFIILSTLLNADYELILKTFVQTMSYLNFFFFFKESLKL